MDFMRVFNEVSQESRLLTSENDQKLKAIFDFYDQDRDGLLRPREALQIFSVLGIPLNNVDVFKGLPVVEYAVLKSALVAALAEMRLGITTDTRRLSTSSIQKQPLRKSDLIMNILDREKKGYIQKDRLRKYLELCGVDFTPAQYEWMFDVMKSDMDIGHVRRYELVHFLDKYASEEEVVKDDKEEEL